MAVSKQDFIKSLESLLMLADIGVVALELEDEKTVKVHFSGGGKRRANIAMDSHVAIIKDVLKVID